MTLIYPQTFKSEILPEKNTSTDKERCEVVKGEYTSTHMFKHLSALVGL